MKTEDDLDGVEKVIWRNKIYDVGNRRHKLVELWKDNELVRTVNIASVKKFIRGRTMKKVQKLAKVFTDNWFDCITGVPDMPGTAVIMKDQMISLLKTYEKFIRKQGFVITQKEV